MRLVRKHDLSCARHFTDAQSRAILAAQSGSSDAAHRDTNLAILRQARRSGLWLACDCREEQGEDPPLLTSCYVTDDQRRYWRTLADHPRHHARCPFARFRTHHHDAATLPPPRTDHVEILYDTPPGDRLATSCDQTGHGGERAAQRPPLSRLLLSLIERAGLNRLSSGSNLASPSDWRSLLVQATGTFTLGNGEPLSELWFHRPAAWTSTAVHAQLRQKRLSGPRDTSLKPFCAGLPSRFPMNETALRSPDLLGVVELAKGNVARSGYTYATG